MMPAGPRHRMATRLQVQPYSPEIHGVKKESTGTVTVPCRTVQYSTVQETARLVQASGRYGTTTSAVCCTENCAANTRCRQRIHVFAQRTSGVKNGPNCNRIMSHSRRPALHVIWQIRRILIQKRFPWTNDHREHHGSPSGFASTDIHDV